MLKVTLWKFRGNSLDSQNSWASGISESAIKNAVDKVILAMHRTFVKKYLRPPTRREAKKEALAFHNISGYPPIPYAAMDGCQIPVQFIQKYMRNYCLDGQICCKFGVVVPRCISCCHPFYK